MNLVTSEDGKHCVVSGPFMSLYGWCGHLVAREEQMFRVYIGHENYSSWEGSFVYIICSNDIIVIIAHHIFLG